MCLLFTGSNWRCRLRAAGEGFLGSDRSTSELDVRSRRRQSKRWRQPSLERGQHRPREDPGGTTAFQDRVLTLPTQSCRWVPRQAVVHAIDRLQRTIRSRTQIGDQIRTQVFAVNCRSCIFKDEDAERISGGEDAFMAVKRIVKTEHWMRVKALSRLATGVADQYDSLKPVADVKQ